MHNMPDSEDFYLFGEGSLYKAYKIFGAHVRHKGASNNVRFLVWAPNAIRVKVIGSFNGWKGEKHVMETMGESGIWSLCTPDAKAGDLYKYEIYTKKGEVLRKADPFAFLSEIRPGDASIIYDLEGYLWKDESWQKRKKNKNMLKAPINIYEVHLGSWKKKENGEAYSYKELSEELPGYVKEMGYTHVELMPVMEHPFDGSWGYQITGYYSATSRYGSPQDLMHLIDCFHKENIGVILDWVPSHFCKDDQGLRLFDGEPVFEYSEKTKAEQSQWGTLSFDLGKNQVNSFLISNIMFWLEMFHADGIRVDAVSSILYLDFQKKEGEWMPNKYGGRENLEGIDFLKKLNSVISTHFPEALMIAEESSTWPQVSMPVSSGGLGFNLKWNMGWMNDVLKYMEIDPLNRKNHHNLLTFSFFYAFSENFVLALSHDEVVHGKKSLLEKMPGDYWQKFANLRLLFGYMMTHPGKKSTFMGGEIGQFIEWDENKSLDWFLLDYEMHGKMQKYVKDLNRFYLKHDMLWEMDHVQEGFSWIDANNQNQSVITFMRKNIRGEYSIIICNFTPMVYENYRIGVPETKQYKEIFNSDAVGYGGSGFINHKNLKVDKKPWHNQNYSLELRIPPLGILILKPID